jgi:hypothetical protein
LQYFISTGLLTWERSPFELESELIKTCLFGIADGFNTNDSIRQLLSIRMRKEHPQQFIKACNAAIRFFQNELQRLQFRPELHAIEMLFLELQLLSLTQDRDPKKLISKFKGVTQYLKRTLARKQILASFEAYLIKDWELNFILNYLFQITP